MVTLHTSGHIVEVLVQNILYLILIYYVINSIKNLLDILVLIKN